MMGGALFVGLGGCPTKQMVEAQIALPLSLLASHFNITMSHLQAVTGRAF